MLLPCVKVSDFFVKRMRVNRYIMAVALCVMTIVATAQNVEQDKSIRTGVLSNGLTYYIKHNSFLPNTADFYLAQRVGSILEEPHQRGLAHFLEHMAFNGSQSFPPNGENLGMVKWCERVGIKFGVNLNAYTSIDQTVYNISSVPVQQKGVLDTCLLILHDWSGFLTLDPKEIDKERGVVTEEWRTRSSSMAMQRLMEASASVIYKGTKYEDCMPIGHMNIVNSFPYNALTDYYKKWYRPDLQAVIIVGDVNVDSVEAKIKHLFGAIPTAQNAAERPYYPVKNNDKMIVFTAKDEEQPVASFSLYMKRDITPREERLSWKSFKEEYITKLLLQMLNSRLDRLTQEHSKELLSASVQDGNFFISTTKDAFSIQATLTKNDLKEGIRLLIGEVERARSQGFLLSEFQRAKDEILNDAQNKFNDRTNIRNSEYVDICLNNFLENKPILNAEYVLNQTKLLNKTITLKEVNAFVKELVVNKNMVTTLFVPKQKDFVLPSENEIEHIIVSEQLRKHSPYKEESTPKHFMTHLPTSGAIIKEEKAPYGYRLFTLSNGMRVFYRNTSFENDEVNMRIFGLGGKSVYRVDDMPTLSYMIASVMCGGVGTFNDATLQKMLLGKTVNVTPFMGNDMQGLKGFSTVRNAEDLFQLTYLYFTSPRKDNQAFEKLMSSQKEFLTLRDVNSNVVYNDSLLDIVYDNDARVKTVKASELNKVDYNRALSIYKECFKNAANYDVIITGNIAEKQLKPLLCKYLASLPSTKQREEGNKTDVVLKEKTETHYFVVPQKTPSVHTSVVYSNRIPYSVDNEIKTDVLSQLLRALYIQRIREDKGAAYGVSVSGTLSQYPFPQMILKVGFKTAPEKYKEAIPLVDEALTEMAEKGVDGAELNKIKAYLLKTYDEVVLTNDYWDEMLFNYLYNGVDYDNNYKERIAGLTPERMQEFIKQFVMNMGRIEVTMSSERLER